MSARRPLLFYSSWPLGYHNVEAERKALAFADAGYAVVYVAGVGIRNPRLSSLGKLADRAARKLAGPRGRRPAPKTPGLETAALLVAPPRQLAAVRRLNARWLERQLRAVLPSWHEAVVWVRWPTPELVDILPKLNPAAIVYEVYDANWHTPGITGRWVEIFERAERDLVACSDLVVVPTPPLAERYRGWGSEVALIPHGVELSPWRPRPPRAGPKTIGFVGTLDYRLDVDVLRRVAAAHPEWRFRLIGPAQEGFSAARVGDLANVSVEPAVPYARVPEIIAELDAGLLPYFDHPHYQHSESVKNLEYMAAGKPVVVRPAPSLERFSDLLYFATNADEFLRELERALAEDSPERALARRAVAEENTWDRRLDEMLAALAGVLERKRASIL